MPLLALLLGATVTIEYEDRPYHRGGFLDDRAARPVRFARVEFLGAGGDALTDAGGRVDVPEGTTQLIVRPAGDFGEVSPPPDVSWPTGSLGPEGGLIAGDAAPPFNLYDCAVASELAAREMDRQAGLASPEVRATIRWPAPDTRYDAPASRVEVRNDDVWDDDVVFHELGHRVMATRSRIEPVEGAWRPDDPLEPRLAFAEGAALWWSCLARHLTGGYRDIGAYTDNNPTGPAVVEILGGPPVTPGSAREVAQALWERPASGTWTTLRTTLAEPDATRTLEGFRRPAPPPPTHAADGPAPPRGSPVLLGGTLLAATAVVVLLVVLRRYGPRDREPPAAR